MNNLSPKDRKKEETLEKKQTKKCIEENIKITEKKKVGNKGKKKGRKEQTEVEGEGRITTHNLVCSGCQKTLVLF